MYAERMPDWGKWARRAASVALAPVTGGVSLAGLAPDVPGFDKALGSAKEWFLGQDPSQVQLPPEVAAAQARRAELAALVMGGNPIAAQDAAREAAATAGQTAQGRLLSSIQSTVAGARGLGSLGARREGLRRLALGQGEIAGQVAEQSAGAMAQAAQADEQRRLAALGMAADLNTQTEQAALQAEEWRKANARKGAADVVLGTIGAGVGGYFGGAQGAAAGGQLGAGLGGTFTRS